MVGVMHGLILEEYSFGSNPGVKDLVRHLYTRMNCGQVVIVAANPANLMSPLKKQWFRLCRKVQRERSSTLNATRIYELSGTIQRMQTLRFSSKWSMDIYEPADVYLATAEQLLAWAPEANCRTLYVTCDLQTEQLYIITSTMREGALVVGCRLVDKRR
jgi:hypothetical protein